MGWKNELWRKIKLATEFIYIRLKGVWNELVKRA